MTLLEVKKDVHQRKLRF